MGAIHPDKLAAGSQNTLAQNMWEHHPLIISRDTERHSSSIFLASQRSSHGQRTRLWSRRISTISSQRGVLTVRQLRLQRVVKWTQNIHSQPPPPHSQHYKTHNPTHRLFTLLPSGKRSLVTASPPEPSLNAQHPNSSTPQHIHSLPLIMYNNCNACLQKQQCATTKDVFLSC